MTDVPQHATQSRPKQGGRHAQPNRGAGLAAKSAKSRLLHTVARTAAFNLTATVAAGLGGVILARAVGPAVRGEYAAVTAWFGIALMVGGMGQPAALCFYAAKDPRRASEYVATSRAMMLLTGSIALVVGLSLASVLARGDPTVIVGYRIAFCASILAFVGASYTFSLQARDLLRWNVVRVSQPLLSVVAIVALWRLRLLTLNSALAIASVTMLLQLGLAYFYCRRTGLAPGHAQRAMVKPLATYGIAQIAGLTPAVLNAQLDQLVLSQTVPAAQLGRYAIAVSLTMLPAPMTLAIGYVAFPWLAARETVNEATYRLQRLAILGSAGIAVAVLLPMALVAHWLVPLAFGIGYAGAVPLLWILTPGAVFLTCSQVLSDVLRGRNQPIVVAKAQGIAVVITVVLLLALLPVVGVAGAAIASTVAYGIALVALLRSLKRLRRSDDKPVSTRHMGSQGLVQEMHEG